MTDSQTPSHDRETVEERIIPLVEERVRIDKRVIEGRAITVTTRPEVETSTVSEPLRQETVSVERREIGKVVDAVPEPREENGTTIIPVVEERLRIVRELVLVEEVHIRRDARTEQFETEVERTRMVVDIDEG